ncbi:hypothetical protein [Pseudomonas sp. EggHat1]|uniref:hypothetical protein n=1 Tax=Pseudomonas sp. EggHat1 TaxID=2761624 RepID=UPI00186866AA|nr:hypothetical protein [Pseudomonas sp. EggHat1]
MKKLFSNRLSYLVATFVSGVLLSVASDLQAASWGAVENATPFNGYGTFLWGWPSESDHSPICFTSDGCIVTVGPYDPRGSFPYGALNNPSLIAEKIIIQQGQTTYDAYVKWVAQHGTSGGYTRQMWPYNVRLETTCYAFQVFAGSGSGTRTGQVLPGGQCGKVPPPNLSCTLNLPSQIDHGTVTTGETSVKEVTGTVNCNQSVNAQLSSQFVNGTVWVSGKLLFDNQSTRNLTVNGTASFTLKSELTVEANAPAGPAELYFLVFADFY